MATLKEHQAAMVDLLANGSGIPASASRLAHAMHDLISFLRNATKTQQELDREWLKEDATTPGLNDKALSKREKALKTDSPAKWPTPAEQRVKELENTCNQLRESNKTLRRRLDCAENEVMCLRSVVDLPDTQCLHTPFKGNDGGAYCADCGEEL